MLMTSGDPVRVMEAFRYMADGDEDWLNRVGIPSLNRMSSFELFALAGYLGEDDPWLSGVIRTYAKAVWWADDGQRPEARVFCKQYQAGLEVERRAAAAECAACEPPF